MKINVDHLDYHVMAARNCFFKEERILRNNAFSCWKSLWQKVYESSGSDYKLSSDDFVRQDLLCALTVKNQIAAIHLYSFFDIYSLPDLDCKYFIFFNKNYLDYLKKNEVSSVMSMEYLSVMPEFRKAIVGVPLSSLISELGTRVFGLSSADAIVAPARNDVKVNEAAYDIGFRCVEKETIQRGFVCDLVACLQGDQKRSAIPFVSEYADMLWNKRKIYRSAQSLLVRSNETNYNHEFEAA